jgi:SgrR family transcriptional regulator
MQLINYYQSVRKARPDVPEFIETEITMDELASIFICSRRNVNLIVKQMQELQWIEWQPGRGRGNRSTITFLIEFSSLIIQTAKSLVLRDDIKSALELIQQNSLEANQTSSFFQWLNEQFGYHIDTKKDKMRDILRIPYMQPIYTLDPILVNRRTETHLNGQIFDTLVRYEDTTKTIIPHLAHYWESDETGQTWTFFLRKGVLFHDGSELTAHDVAYSLSRLQNLECPYSWLVEDIKSTVVLNDWSIRIELHRRNRLFLYTLSYEKLSIVHRRHVEGTDKFHKFPIGTGAFKVVQNDESKLILGAHPYYFKGRPHLDSIEFWIIPESACYNAASLDDKSRQFLTFRPMGDSSKLEGVERVEIGGRYLTFNQAKVGVQQRGEFRQAIHLAIDRKKIVDELKEFRFGPASSMFPYHNRIDYILSHSLEKARALLLQSGYRGEAIHLYTSQRHEKDAVWIKEQVKKIGVTLNINFLEPSELLKREVMCQADIIMGGAVAENNIEFFMLDIYKSKNSYIRNLIGNNLRRKIDDEISLILEEPSAEIRIRKLHELEFMLRDDFAVLFIYHFRQVSYYHPSLRGVALNSLGWMDYRDLWFDPRSIT